jgi:hypothetical protein
MTLMKNCEYKMAAKDDVIIRQGDVGDWSAEILILCREIQSLTFLSRSKFMLLLKKSYEKWLRQL